MCVKFLNTYTLKQYKGSYPDLLERHKLEYEDHNEYTFINTELESFHNNFIEIKDIEELPFQFQFQKSFTDDELREALVSQREFKDFAVKSNLSSSMIIDFLESRLQELENESNSKVLVPKDVNKIKLTVDQIALKMVYEGNTLVTREEHGNDLYNKVTYWLKRDNRTANDGSNLQLQNKIKRFEKVIDLLDDESKQRAIDEVKILKSYLPKN